MADTHRIKVKIANKLGLHARPAMALVDTANRFTCDVRVYRADSDEIIDAKSIMSVMMLAATCGTVLHVEATGADAEAALAEIVALVKRKFDEE